MKLYLKKATALVLSFSLMFSAVPATFGVNPDPTEKEVYEELYNKFKVLLGENKDRNASNVYYILQTLQSGDVKGQVTAWLNANESEETMLLNYGIDADAIESILDGIIAEFPTTFEELIKNKSNIFSRLYNDADGISYTEYKDDVADYAERMYRNLPEPVITELNKFTNTGTNKVTKTKLVVFQLMVNSIIDETLASETYDSYTKLTTNKDFNIPTSAKTSIVSVLKANKNDGVADENIETLATVFYNMSNAMVNIVESTLKADDTADNEDEFLLAYNIAKELDLVKVNTINTAPTDNGGGSTGGSTGGAVTPPATNLGKDDAKATADIKDSIPAAGTATPEQKSDITAKTEVLIKGIVDIEKSTNADKQVTELNKTISEVVKTLDVKEASNVAIQFIGLMNKALDNPNVSQAEAEAMVKDFVGTTLSDLVSKKDVSNQDVKEAKESVLALVNKLIKNAATVEVTNSKAPVAGEKVVFEITNSQITSTIANALKTSKEMVANLDAGGLKDVSKMLSNNINIKLPEVNENEEVSLGLDAAAVASLGENNLGVTVEAKGISFMLPAELLKAAKSGMTIESKPVSAEDKTTLTDKTNGGTTKELTTMDLSVVNGTETVKGQVELSFSLADLKDVNLDELMVGVFENGKWTKLSYEVIDGKVVFTAPHFSIYSLMTFKTTFNDVSSNWANKYITSLAAKGIISGRSETSFDPQGTITRAEFATLLVNYLKLNDEVTSNYKDVEAGTWYYNLVGRAALNNISAGTVNGNFRPNEAITREEMAVMLVKAYQAKYGYALTGTALPFSDHSGISETSKVAVYAAKANGIISGYEDNTFKPLGNATRAEAATIIYMFLQK